MAISLANNSYSPTRLGFPLDEKGPQQKQSMWHRLGLRRWLGRDDRDASPERAERRRQASPLSPHNHHSHGHGHHNHRAASADNFPRAKQDNLTRRLSRKVGVGLPGQPPSNARFPNIGIAWPPWNLNIVVPCPPTANR